MYLCSLEFRWQVSFYPILCCFPFISLFSPVYFLLPLSDTNLFSLLVAAVYLDLFFYRSSSTSSFTRTSFLCSLLNKTDLCWVNAWDGRGKTTTDLTDALICSYSPFHHFGLEELFKNIIENTCKHTCRDSCCTAVMSFSCCVRTCCRRTRTCTRSCLYSGTRINSVVSPYMTTCMRRWKKAMKPCSQVSLSVWI